MPLVAMITGVYTSRSLNGLVIVTDLPRGKGAGGSNSVAGMPLTDHQIAYE